MSLLFALALMMSQPTEPVVTITGPGGLTATMPLEPAVSDGRLTEAAKFIAARQAAAALPLVDAIIADHERKYRSNDRTLYFSARALSEGFVYATLAGAAKKQGFVLNGDWAEAYFLKAFALIDLNRPDEAIKWLDKAAALAPMNAQILAERAEWHKSRRDWKKAYREFESARSAAGFSDERDQAREEGRAIRGMAFVRIEQGRLDDAEKLLGEALKLDPADARAREELDLIATMRKR